MHNDDMLQLDNWVCYGGYFVDVLPAYHLDDYQSFIFTSTIWKNITTLMEFVCLSLEGYHYFIFTLPVWKNITLLYPVLFAYHYFFTICYTGHYKHHTKE